MPRRRPPPPSLGATPDELEAHFYDAMRRADLDALMAVWADDEEVVCVHPGGTRVTGAAAIRASFEAIFANGAIPVEADQVHRLEAMGAHVHHLHERVPVQTDGGPRTAWVIATNVYVQTAQGWRMVVHHASPGSLQAPELDGAPSTLH